MTDKDLNGAPVRSGLVLASEMRWSGLLQVVDGADHVGTIHMRYGDIVWAVCKYQREDLGTFLHHLGYLSADQYAEVRRRYEELGSSKKIAAILEEMGLVDRTMLGTYLALHIRFALTCMIQNPVLTLQAQGGESEADENISFPLEAVLPEQSDAGPEPQNAVKGKPVELRQEAAEEPDNNVLVCLGGVPGYRASIIAGMDGRLFAAHGFVADEENRNLMMSVPVSWLKSSIQTAAAAELGVMDMAVLECGSGTLLVRWISGEAGIFLAVYMEKGGKVGIARHRIDACVLDLSGFVTRRLAMT